MAYTRECWPGYTVVILESLHVCYASIFTAAMLAVDDIYVASVLQILGVNVQPLLAVGGVSGIAIGFGAQSVSANAITGINLVCY